MWVFVWKATEDHNARSEIFMDFENAWDYFKDMRVSEFPYLILEIGRDTSTGLAVAHEMTKTDFLDKGLYPSK